jgi:hypothetical protein
MLKLVNWFLLAASAFALPVGGPETTAAVATTIAYRRTVIDPVITFDRCAAAAATGHAPEALDTILGPRAALALSPGTDECRTRSTPRPRRGARIDSVAVADSIAHVHVTVYRSDRAHSETYNLRRLPPSGGRTWGVQDVRIWGAVQYHPVRSEIAPG